VQSELDRITRLQIQVLDAKLKEQDIALRITDAAVETLSARGYDVQYGARPLKRVIQRYVADPLAMKVLAGELASGMTVTVDADERSQITFTITATEETA
jgi:ATP-dependent Clp protease ATP-binding subunit ClpB